MSDFRSISWSGQLGRTEIIVAAKVLKSNLAVLETPCDRICAVSVRRPGFRIRFADSASAVWSFDRDMAALRPGEKSRQYHSERAVSKILFPVQEDAS